jgi:very-short-patch-repair endonuclease
LEGSAQPSTGALEVSSPTAIDRYIVDFVTIEGKLIVEVDGATHSTAKELTHDAERARILASLGFHIVRVTNIDVYGNLEGVQEMIASTLGSI